MDDDWAPLLNKDCMLFSPNGISLEDDFHLTSLDFTSCDKVIKSEPQEETSEISLTISRSVQQKASVPVMFGLDNVLDFEFFDTIEATLSSSNEDYHGSSSGSPSSSLSSPDMKDNLGVDLSFCIPFGSNIHPFLNSPTSSSGSPFGSMFPGGTITQQNSPLPPVSHFSHQIPHQQSPNNQQHGAHQHQMLTSPSIHQTHSALSSFNGASNQETITFFDKKKIFAQSKLYRRRKTNGLILDL
ncbi:hypothetical protein NECAME_08205 [Necator americanus]|uniref:Uncharacterized protein n=1 Tax=Necator americanus TaxID=51031 RepID=W2TLZ2_NECAM|nr:hypothetical protein NECAME_08205 [Necator americanus]ETN82052.1 hypothetical protein NECAME_08205 [Necator americanus]